MTPLPKCPKCGGEMVRRIEPIRLPEFFLWCEPCHSAVDMTPDQYYGREPEPEWMK